MAAMQFWKAFLLLLGLAVSACEPSRVLDVRPTHLRNLDIEDDNQPMIRGEQRRLLHGAIGVREQEQRLGHYYVVLWEDEAVGEPVEVVFEYQQATTASKILTQRAEFAPSDEKGRAEFRVIGDSYLKGGRVLAWRCRLLRGGREVASRHSYLWK